MRIFVLFILVVSAVEISGLLVEVLQKLQCQICEQCFCNGGNNHTCFCYDCGDVQSKCNDHQTHQAVTTDPKPVTSNSVSLRSGKCDSVKVFDAVARNEFVLNENGQVCEGGSDRHGNDAFVMSLCHAPEPAKWMEGELLLKDGVCTSSAEKYTAVFFHYSAAGNDLKLAGILLSCNGTDLKIFKQDCLTTPRVEHVNPTWLSNMYVLTWHH